MWRNEILCIQQLLQHELLLKHNSNPTAATSSLQHSGTSSTNGVSQDRTMAPSNATYGENDLELVIGISWCEKKGGPTVDLDLSAIAFDKNWEQVYVCSYQVTNVPGAQHSGDITSAPFPGGARESIHFKFREMAAEVKYVAFTVHNYSRQNMDDVLSDASIFVAHGNKTGTGPGGLDIIVASALKSSSTKSIGVF